MIFLSYSGLIIAISSFFSSTIVFFHNPSRQTNIAWGLFGLAVSIWGWGLFFAFRLYDYADVLFWSRFLNLAAIFIPIFFFHFVNSYLNKKPSSFLIVSYLLVIAYFIVSLVFIDHFIPEVVRQPHFEYYPKAGVLYFFFVPIFSFYVVLGIYQLWKDYVVSFGLRKNQMKYLFWGMLIGFSGGATTFPLVFNIPIFPFGTWLVTLYVVLTTYAITKHHLLDIEIFIKRGLVYSLLTALLTGTFVSLIFAGNYFFSGLTGYNSLWVSIAGAFAISLMFQPLREIIQAVVDRTFFRARYDYQRILSRYSHSLSQPMSDLSRFSRIAPYLLTKSMKLSGGSVMVLNREDHSYVIRAGEKDAGSLEGYVVQEDSPLIQEIMRRRKGFSLEEILEAEKHGTEKDQQKYQAIADEMRRLRCVLIIPSISEGQYFNKPTLLSTLNLGKKMSEQSFSWEDIDFLRTLANQAGISIEYAFILEEFKNNQQRVVQSEKLAVIGTTTAGVAHELKNPLTYINTLAQVLPLKWDDLEFREMVEKMLPAETQRMGLIIEGLLDYSRSRELTLKPLDVSAVIEKALALLAYEIRKQRIEVKQNFQHQQEAYADSNRMMQVFMNIIANAVQAMGNEGGNLLITSCDNDKTVKIIITDTGPGMTPEQQKKIFDPFFTTKETGTGLGLPISKKIVEEHHGTIDLQSELGKGTTFTITLPVEG